MLLCGIHSILKDPLSLQAPSHSPAWISRACHNLVSFFFAQRETIERHQLGVWKLSFARSSGWDLRKLLGNVATIFSSFPLFRRLATEVYALRPGLSVLYVASSLWNGIEPAVLLYLSSRLLEQIETVITTGRPNTSAILNALVARVLCVVATTYLGDLGERLLPQLTSAVKKHFGLFLLRAQLRLDIPTVNDPKGNIEATSEVAWESFEFIVQFFGDLLNTCSQLVLIAHSARKTGSPTFLILCLARPLLSMGGIYLWELPYVFYTNNASYKRIQALEEMASTEYRSEVLSGDLVEYILDEHQKATSNLGSLSADYPGHQLSLNEHPIHSIIPKLFSDLPMMYCAFVAITQPRTLSVSQIAIWSESSQNLSWSIQTVLDNVQRFRRSCQSLHDLYDAENIKTMIVDGETSYSSSQEEKSKGMSFDVRHLSFAYPGSQSSEGAINDISFSIKAGQLVVIVGSNGSGKSTIIKLLTRVYDPTSDRDSILVDGLPISKYRIADLRRSTAVLTQEHSLFPLSLGENIGLGHVNMMDDLTALQHAAEMGGASHCLSKVKDGFETVLDPRNQSSSGNLPDDEDHPLNVELSQLPKAIELSGGEEQRIVAARTFMRFNSGLVRFVAVDEPSSALDPEGEAALFENLIKAREGKTLVFVTHRFGHLTKHADLILCMKDGKLVESGTHAELLGLNGVYANLYNVQASAFIDQIEPKD